MKQIFYQISSMLVATIAVALVLTGIIRFMIPGLRQYNETVFVPDSNLVLRQSGNIQLATAQESIVLNTDTVIQVLDNLIEATDNGVDLKPALLADLEKPLAERNMVYIYEIRNGASYLRSEIDSTREGNWEVLVSVSGADGSRKSIKYFYEIVNPFSHDA